MQAAKPSQSGRRAVDWTRRREQPIARIAKDLRSSGSCLRRGADWVRLTWTLATGRGRPA
jgi:hypothetical protein